MNNLPKTVTRQRSDCNLNQGPSAPESSTLTTRLPNHPIGYCTSIKLATFYIIYICHELVNLFKPKILFLLFLEISTAHFEIFATDFVGQNTRFLTTVRQTDPWCLCLPSSEIGSSPHKGCEGNCGPGGK